MKRTTIFRQLILNIVIPVVIALLGLGILNYLHTQSVVKESNEATNELVAQQIKSIIALQDASLKIVEKPIVERLKKYSNTLINEIFKHTANIENADLIKIRNGLVGERDSMVDIFVIDRNGDFINSTGGKDLNLNFYNFGTNHGKYFDNVFKQGVFINGGFTIEASTKQPKIYTYQPTLDGKYMVELGISSENANQIIEAVKNRLIKLSQNPKNNVKSAKLIINADSSLFSLTKEDIENDQLSILYKIFKKTKNDTSTYIHTDDKYYNFSYIYLHEKASNLYNYVIQIISDRTDQIAKLRIELFKSLLVFGFALFIVIILIYLKARVITTPIKKLVSNVMRITSGHFNERAAVIGNNEITKLSEQFNLMIETIESYYNELEEKVRERTAEIQQQNEEIKAQRDSIENHLNELSIKNNKLKIAYEHIEEQKRDIEDSIYYAKRIQNAILPAEQKVKKLLPNSFILYYPKAIVSGDFYWMQQVDHKVVFAAVDCTGHGVPGAFMSIVGSSQLNNIVKEGISKPSEILDLLNFGITHLLGQSKSNATPMRDGMDIALCSINYKENVLEFAGANNPLYLIRDGEMIEYKANRFPIGNYVEEKLHQFSNHKIELQSGDMLYIFSDGFRDQFGGPKGRKYMTKRFRELLLTINEKDVQEQYHILNKELNAWKGNHEQVDDILIIGVKIP